LTGKNTVHPRDGPCQWEPCSEEHTAALLLAAVVAAALGRQLALLLDLLHQQGERFLDVGARLGAVSRMARPAGPPTNSQFLPGLPLRRLSTPRGAPSFDEEGAVLLGKRLALVGGHLTRIRQVGLVAHNDHRALKPPRATRRCRAGRARISFRRHRPGRAGVRDRTDLTSLACRMCSTNLGSSSKDARDVIEYTHRKPSPVRMCLSPHRPLAKAEATARRSSCQLNPRRPPARAGWDGPHTGTPPGRPCR